MRIPLILLTVLLASCSTYKMDIRQGNYISGDMRDKIRLGMSKQQVHYVLGTPMISDPFHAARWDYVYRLEQKGKVVEDHRLTVYFDGDNLARAEEDGKPLEGLQAMEREAEQQDAAPDVAAEDDVKSAVLKWADAWKARDTERYLASYGDVLKGEGEARAAWEEGRRRLVADESSALVEVREVTVRVLDSMHASATFMQVYRAGEKRDSMRKMLKLERSGSVWLIVAEDAAE